MGFSGSADAILTLFNAGANVEAEDKDGLTGKHLSRRGVNIRTNLTIVFFL